jgi:lipoprotein-releasing system ATP-binding protein
MLTADAIVMEYPSPAGPLAVLRGASLHLQPGESASIVGPSGSGKSTLLNILGTLERPTAGRVALDGTDPFALAELDLARFRSRCVGFVFQEHHLLPQCSVLENVLIPTVAWPRPDGDAVRRARSLLERVGLAQRLDHRPAQLSGGERQRVALARALINQPTVVLADEPTGSLDRTSAAAVADLLMELHAQEGRILLLVTHNSALAERAAKRFELVDGKLLDASQSIYK